METIDHVRDSVKQIDKNSWLIGSKHVLRLVQGSCDSHIHCIWRNSSDNACYTISATPDSLLNATPIAPLDSQVRKIHDAGDQSVVFSFGDTIILKIRVATEGTRREHQTIAFLEEEQLSFDVPRVLFYMEEAGKTYLMEPYIPGKRLNEAWWDMDEKEKEHVVDCVSEICSELQAFQSHDLTGIDHNWLDPFQDQHDYEVLALQKHCEELGMDCSTFVLSHNDLGPTNIIVNGDQITILDWEMAGYMPLEWVRTKFAVCGALDVERVGDARIEINSEYRTRVERKLGQRGFPEVTEAYKKMKKPRLEKHEKWLASRP